MAPRVNLHATLSWHEPIIPAPRRAHERCHEAVDCREEEGLLQKVGDNTNRTVLREPYFFFFPFFPFPPLPASSRPVWKSFGESGAPENSSLSHFAAMTLPSWLDQAVRNRHRHAIEQASRRWNAP